MHEQVIDSQQARYRRVLPGEHGVVFVYKNRRDARAVRRREVDVDETLEPLSTSHRDPDEFIICQFDVDHSSGLDNWTLNAERQYLSWHPCQDLTRLLGFPVTILNTQGRVIYIQ